MEYLRIKEICKANNITSTELAGKVGITKVNMINITNEKTKPSFDTLCKIASALGVGVSELFSDSQKSRFVCPVCGAELELKQH